MMNTTEIDLKFEATIIELEQYLTFIEVSHACDLYCQMDTPNIEAFIDYFTKLK